VELASEHQSGSHAGTDREEGEVVDSSGHSPPLLSERSEVDVVLDHHVETQAGAQLGAEPASAEPWNVVGQLERSARALDDRRNSDNDAVDQVGGEAGRRDERIVKRRGRRQGALGVCLG
jgi:hypothetical protein